MRKNTSLALACACLLSMTGSPTPAVMAATPFNAQPPALAPSVAKPRGRMGIQGSIDGIGYIDVMTAAGYDLAATNYGKEPSIAVNPLDPNQIVLTPFSGSNWGIGGNSSLLYSGDGGASWSYSLSVPAPAPTNINCPCDQTMDWGRDGVLYGTFLYYSSGGTVRSVYSAQATAPTNPSSWIYRTVSGQPQPTNLGAFTEVDQPWLLSGPLPGDNGQTNVCVAYDNMSLATHEAEIRAADSPGFDPLDFTRDASTHTDGLQYTDVVNPGNRIAVGPTGLIFNLFERYVGTFGGGVQRVTYLVTVSADGGQTWSVANSDHPSGAKIVAADVYSFQGEGSKVAGVNALIGGITAISVDPTSGTAWIVYGRRVPAGGHDLLFLVPVTYSNGNLNVGTARIITNPSVSSYMPAVAVLPNGEVGVFFLTWNGTVFAYNFLQTTDGGQTFSKLTALPSFSSPFTDDGTPKQRILGDYLQVKAVGCEFFGTYPARGDGVNSVSSIDPYFMRAPASTDCVLPRIDTLIQPVACVGGPAVPVTVVGANFTDGATGRVGGALRTTAFGSPISVNVLVQAGDIANPGTVPIDVIGAAPAGILSPGLDLYVESPAASPGSSLRVGKSGSSVSLDWNATSGARFYRVKRCTASGPCTPGVVGIPSTNSYSETTLNDGNNYWYLVTAGNSCPEVP